MAIKYTVDESAIAKELKFRVGGVDIELVVDDETNRTSEVKKEKEKEEEDEDE